MFDLTMAKVRAPALLAAALLVLFALPLRAEEPVGDPATPIQPPALPPPPTPPGEGPARDIAAPAFFRSLRAARRTGPIVLDGRPDEQAWQAAEEAQAFTQLQPDEGKAASAATRVRVLWDDQYLYVGAICDDPEPPTERLSRRDRSVDGDWLSVDFDTAYDHQTAYHFQVFAAGQQLDALHFNDTDFTSDWDAAWESEVARTPTGWSVEMRIPLRRLRIPDGATHFGFNVYRRIVRTNEEVQWRFRPRSTPGDVSALGELTGLDGIKPVKALELRPYLAARASRNTPIPATQSAPALFGPCSSNGFSALVQGAACAGLDLTYSLASDLSLVATVNPDFGQVEADARILNLSTFESFFPEKRPFFLEGLDLFKPAIKGGVGGPYGGQTYQLFYSRRIGRTPTTITTPNTPPTPDIPVLPDGATVVYQPAARPVALASKLTGTVGDVSVGALAALEQAVDAQLVDGSGRPMTLRSDEAAMSAVLRLRRPLGERALLGVFASTRDPLFAPGQRHAHVLSGDFQLFNGDRSLVLTTQGSGSLINGGSREVLLDGTVFDPGHAASGGGVSGGAAAAQLDYTAEYVGGLAGVDWLSPTFTTNDLGFMRRANLMRAFGIVNLRQPHPTEYTQRMVLTLYGKEARNASGELTLFRTGGLETFVLFNNYWGFNTGTAYEAPFVDDRELQDGTPLERQRGLALYGGFFSDSRKAVDGGFFFFQRRDLGRSGRYTEFDLNAGFRPHPQLEGSLEGVYSLEQGTIRRLRSAGPVPGSADPEVSLDPGVATQQTREYLFAPLQARAFSVTLRGTFAFSPRLTLQAYAQLFTAGVTYGDALKAIAGPGRATIHYSDLSPANLLLDKPPDNDDRQAGLNLNLILRWEWRLGSTFYLVYAHQTSADYLPPRGLDFGGELATLSRTGATVGDTLLVKIDLLQAL